MYYVQSSISKLHFQQFSSDVWTLKKTSNINRLEENESKYVATFLDIPFNSSQMSNFTIQIDSEPSEKFAIGAVKVKNGKFKEALKNHKNTETYVLFV